MTTFMLIHGAWHGAWCWDRVRGHLEARGHEVATPQLPSDVPGAGRSAYLEVLEKELASHSDVVLVAHSMSGLLAPLLTGNPAVASVVLLAAMVPRPGTAWLDHGPAPYGPAMREAAGRLRFDKAGRSSWDPADAVSLFYGDCQPSDAAEAVARLRSDSGVIYGQPCPELPARRVPVTYLACQRDPVLDPGWNEAAATGVLGAARRQIDTGHSPFWSAPGELATVFEELASRN